MTRKDQSQSNKKKKTRKQSEPLPVDELTWAALLGYWMDFAKSAKALPKNRRGKLWQESTADIITLQALTLALKQLHKLPVDEQAIGLERAEYQINESVANLQDLWADVEEVPEALIEILRDAQAQSLHETLAASVVELVVVMGEDGDDEGGFDEDDDEDEEGDSYSFSDYVGDEEEEEDDDGDDESGGGVLIVDDWRDAAVDLEDFGFEGTLRLAEPGTILVPGEPIGSIECDPEWMREHDGDETVEFITRVAALLEVLGSMVNLRSGSDVRHAQVYRVADNETGQLVRDVIRDADDDPVAGRPVILDVITPDFDGLDNDQLERMDPEKWLQTQMRCWPQGDGDEGFEIEDERE